MTFYQAAAALEAEGKPFAVVTFTGGRGHLPQEPGAKMLVTLEGLAAGTVGGGKVEARAIERAQELLREGANAPELVTWNLQRDLDMTCGGEMSFLLEAHFPKAWNIVIYGAGHVAQALARVLDGIDCRVVCIDSRPEWREKLPAKVIAKDWAEPAKHVQEVPSGAFHVVMTQDHASDILILAALAQIESPYVGVIGSATKAGKVRAELRALGCAEAYVEKILCPMGIRVGGNKPGEIAVSIAAQLLEFRGSGKKER